jgi:glutamate carboxypeptidase
MNLQAVFSRIDELTKEYTDLWIELCELESPSDDKAGVDAVGARFLSLARERGWRTEVMEHAVAGNAICLTLFPNAVGKPVVFSGHMDTVHPRGLFGSPAVRMDEERIYGPGVCDCKGGLVAALLAAVSLEDVGFDGRPIRVILQSDEEVSSILSGQQTLAFMAEHARDAVAFLNCEPPATPNRITVERKGILRYDFHVTGRAAHSSKCYEGVSAIAEAAHKILALEEWKDCDGITCNCGMIEGGSAPNTVAEECHFSADIRYKAGSEREVEERVREIAAHSYIEGASCTVTLRSARVPMARDEKNMALFARANEILVSQGFEEQTPYFANGGADSANMSCEGIPVIDSLGVRGGRIHSADEYAYLSALPIAAKKLAALAAFL